MTFRQSGLFLLLSVSTVCLPIGQITLLPAYFSVVRSGLYKQGQVYVTRVARRQKQSFVNPAYLWTLLSIMNRLPKNGIAKILFLQYSGVESCTYLGEPNFACK